MLKPRKPRTRNILVIDGHPDRMPGRFVHALARAYAAGAAAQGHAVRWIRLSELDIPLLAARDDWEKEPVPEPLRRAQELVEWAQHLAIFYPLWLGDMPAGLKALFEQILRPGFAFRYGSGHRWIQGLSGRSARIVVTMGMPAIVYRLWYRALSVRLLRRNILTFVGIGPVRATIIGNVEHSAGRNAGHLRRMVALGEQGI